MLVTDYLLGNYKFDIAHVNVVYERVDASVGRDHEPNVARFVVNNGNGEKK